MPDAIPAVLRRTPQWVCWRVDERDGTPTKVPVAPATGGYASVADPGTWTDYETAVAAWRNAAAVAGVGFVFTATDPFAGVDLDACRDPATNEVADWAVELVRRLDSYTEWSPSGTGIHVLVAGTVPAGRNRRGDLEMYDRDRFFTVTGDRVPGAPTTVKERNEELQAIHTEHIAESEEERTAEPPAAPEVTLSDAELLAKATAAANGEKFQALWDGDTSGYDSHSEADLALCTLLAFWTGGDPQRIEALFARSGLVRDKWRHRADYRKRTIRTAIRHCSAFYDPETHE